MVTIVIDGKKIKAKEKQTVLEVSRENGIEIPTLCSNDALKPYGACRLCVVEVKAGSVTTIETSCTYPVAEGLEVSTSSPKVIEARKLVLHLLLARSPNVKIVKELAAEYGIEKVDPFLRLENDYCILCGQCVRACNEVVQAGAISFAGSGKEKKVDSPFHLTAEECIGCGSCAFVCPTGIIKVRDVDSAADVTPEGTTFIGWERIIENWNRELKFKLCKKSGNPYAPEFMLNRFQNQMNLPAQFFDVSPSYRDYPEVDEELCIGCGACVDECPVGAIQLEEQKKEVKSHILPTHCCGCQTCLMYCVRAAIKVA